ncbi:MAG: profilin family protein [Promethearchaeota archaeon]
MPVDPATAVYDLMQKDPHIIAAAVISGTNEIIYSTDNWDISADVGRVIASWVAQNAQFIMVSGVKYSMLQCEPERLVATSIRGEGSIVAAKDDEHKLIAYLEPDGYAPGAAMDVQRIITSMSSKTPYMGSNTQLGKTVPAAASATPSIDPQLKGEIEAFLEWIKDADGLSGYINYYLQQNNTQIISELSKIYSELRQIFGV